MIKYEDITFVDKFGVVNPIFKFTDGVYTEYSGGFLKYLKPLAGKRVKITIEVIEEGE